MMYIFVLIIVTFIDSDLLFLYYYLVLNLKL